MLDGKAVPYSGYCMNDQVDSGSEVDADGVDLVLEYLKNSREFSQWLSFENDRGIRDSGDGGTWLFDWPRWCTLRLSWDHHKLPDSTRLL